MLTKETREERGTRTRKKEEESFSEEKKKDVFSVKNAREED